MQIEDHTDFGHFHTDSVPPNLASNHATSGQFRTDSAVHDRNGLRPFFEALRKAHFTLTLGGAECPKERGGQPTRQSGLFAF